MQIKKKFRARRRFSIRPIHFPSGLSIRPADHRDSKPPDKKIALFHHPSLKSTHQNSGTLSHFTCSLLTDNEKHPLYDPASHSADRRKRRTGNHSLQRQLRRRTRNHRSRSRKRKKPDRIFRNHLRTRTEFPRPPRPLRRTLPPHPRTELQSRPAQPGSPPRILPRPNHRLRN